MTYLRWPSVLFFPEQFCFLKSCPSFFFYFEISRNVLFFFVRVLFLFCFLAHIFVWKNRACPITFLLAPENWRLSFEIWNYGHLNRDRFLFFLFAQLKWRDNKKFLVCSVFLFKIYGHSVYVRPSNMTLFDIFPFETHFVFSYLASFPWLQ